LNLYTYVYIGINSVDDPRDPQATKCAKSAQNYIIFMLLTQYYYRHVPRPT